MRIDTVQLRTFLTTPSIDRTTLFGAVAAVALVGLVGVLASQDKAPPPEMAMAPAAPPAEMAQPAPQAVPVPPPAEQQATVPPAAAPAPGIASVDQTPTGNKGVAAGKPGMEIAPPKTAETKPKKPPKTAKVEPPPAAAKLPPLEQQALGYTSFSRDVDTISAMKLDNPSEVRDALGRLKRHDPKMMSQGWIANGAEIASKNSAFSASINKELQKRGHDEMVSRLSDPSYLLRLDGAYAAMNDVLSPLAVDTNKLNTLKQRFISTSYEFQKIKKWGALDTPLTTTPTFAAFAPKPENDPRPFVLQAGLFGGKSKTEAPAAVVPTGPTTRALQLAARLAMGDSPDSIAAASPALISDKGLEQCLRWSRLNLNQCMAAAHFPSEEAFCTGTHAVAEVSACWSQLLPTKS